MTKQKRTIVILVFAIIPVLSFAQLISSAESCRSNILGVDYRELVSRADLTYEQQVSYSEEGLPVGNGRMGSAVWTTPTALKFQINRVDVYANNSSTNSFNERHSDYCGGCALVDIDFVDFGKVVFPGNHTKQHLSVYDGLLTVEGEGIKAQVLVWNEQDVMAIKINDLREEQMPVNINLKMLRLPVVNTKNHAAISTLDMHDDKIILTQEFTEGDYHCSSAVVIGILGREGEAKLVDQTELRLSAKPGKGAFTILIASAATFDRDEDVVTAAINMLDAAAGKGYDGISESNGKWWHNFWEKSFIHLQSADGVADYIEAHYTYYLYVMASSSRGMLPPKFNGMLWNSKGDIREWGSQHWWHNVSCLYRGLPASNHFELMDPMFDMYSNMYDACALAASQQWGSKGIFIPEVVCFNGDPEMPEDVAENMRDLYLVRIPWEDRTETFEDYAWTKMPHASRWNWKAPGSWIDGHWIVKDKGAGQYGIQAGPYGHVFGHVVHIFSSGAKIAYQYWLKYQYTQDKEWLRERAYPMLKGIAEFYRNYPNIKKGEDGKYHIQHVNNHEPIWDTRDAIVEISAMQGIMPLVIRASEILNVDADMRPIWREFLENLPPLPRSDMEDVIDPGSPDDPVMWCNGFEPAGWGGESGRNHHTIAPCIHYDLLTLETEDQEMARIANATFESIFHDSIGEDMGMNILSKEPIAAALLGRSDYIKVLIPAQIRKESLHSNRLSPAEGNSEFPGTTIEAQGRAGEAVQLALCQSVPAGPGKEPVIHVFAAWPKEWDAAYTLLTRGGFLITSSMQEGEVEFVELQSQLGGECWLHNPWEKASVTLYRDGKKWKDMDGSLLKFNTRKGEIIVLVKRGFSPDQFKRLILG